MKIRLMIKVMKPTPSSHLLLALLCWAFLCSTAFGQSKWDVTGAWPKLGFVIKSFSGDLYITITNQNVFSGVFKGYDSNGNWVEGTQTGDSIYFHDPGVFGGADFTGTIFTNGMAGGNGYPGDLVIHDTGGTWHGFWVVGLGSPEQMFFELAAPSFVSQPTGVVTNLGAPVQFSALAKGRPAPRYQWQFNGANISGATNPVHVLPVTSPGDAGSYRVEVSNVLGTNMSDAALLGFLDIRCLPGLFIFGAVGQPYQIQAATNLDAVNWETVATIVLTTNQPHVYTDFNADPSRSRFYRAVPVRTPGD